MISLPVLAVSIIMNIVAVFFLLSCILLILLVLIQKGKGGGLSGAFGGGMAGNLLGSKTGDFLTWVTIIMVGIFLTLAIVMDKWYRPSLSYSNQESAKQQQPIGPSAPTGPTESGSQNLPEDMGQPVMPDADVNNS